MERKSRLGILIVTTLIMFPCAFKTYAARENAILSGSTEDSAFEQTQLRLAQQQPPPPPRAATPPAEGAGAGEWVDVPGQWVGGTWVPPHKAWVPANPPPPAGKSGQYAPPPPPQAPPGYGPEASPGYGQGNPDAQYGPPPPYPFSAPPDVVPVPGTYVYFVPNIGVDILFYHGYWYRPFGAYWYRALSYNGPWVYLPPRRVPHVLITLPPGYRRLPHGYRPIPHGELRRNWERWERERHWEHR